MTEYHHGFDLSDMTVEKFQKMLDKFNLIEKDHEKYFTFKNNHVVFCTANHPITGKYYNSNIRSTDEPGYLGYVGISGTKFEVLKIVEYFKDNAHYIKNECLGTRDYI